MSQSPLAWLARFAAPWGPGALSLTIMAVFGLILLLGLWFVLEHLMPLAVARAISKDKNPAVAVILLSVFIGLAILVEASFSTH